MKEFFRLIIFGCIIGVANVIPGVSGGTMAVVLGIYDKLIGSMSRFFSDVKQNTRFIAGVGLGAVSGIYLLSALVKFCISNYAMVTNFFFTGLILGSVPMIYGQTRSMGKSSPRHYIIFLLFIGLMAYLAFAGGNSGSDIMTLNTQTVIYLVIVSFVAAVGMLLPGVSGSMLLLLFGAYYTIMNAVSSRDIITLLPIIAGTGMGLLVGSKIIDFCLRRLPVATYYAILGMVIGSLISVVKNAFTNQPNTLDIVVSSLMLVVGIVISLVFEKWNKKIKQESPAVAS